MNTFFLKISFVIQLTFLCVNNISAQDSTISFFEVIKDDSAVMFFSNSYNFTEKSCAENRRYTKINANGNFNGNFVDKDSANVIIGKGFYDDGLKNGDFETFYSNGQLKSKGKYKDDRPIGQWVYFYEDGKPERELLVNLADTFLIQFYDKKGIHSVIDGNGFFYGDIPARDRFFNTVIIAKGKIVNGKPDGEWESFYGKYPYCTEHFENGIFIYGRHNSVLKGNQKYTEGSYLRTLFMSSYINSLEEFRIFKCSTYKIDTTGKNREIKRNKTTDLDKFWSSVKDIVDRNIDLDAKNGNIKDYQPGENILKISFSVNEAGVPQDYRKLTYFGDQFYNAITEALHRDAKFPAFGKTYYFILTITRSDENKVSYRFNFSNE